MHSRLGADQIKGKGHLIKGRVILSRGGSSYQREGHVSKGRERSDVNLPPSRSVAGEMLLRLSGTQRFDVWSDASCFSEEEGVAKSFIGQVVLGGRRCSLQDISRIAVQRQSVSCDPLALQLMAENAAHLVAPKRFELTEHFSSKRDEVLVSEEGGRSILVCILASILQGQSHIRPQIATCIASLLTHSITPVFSDASSFGHALISAMHGDITECYTPSGCLSARQAFKTARTKPCELYESEAKVIQSPFFFSLGLGCLATLGAATLSQTVDAVAALSCEVIGADVTKFDAHTFESIRMQRGQTSSAAALRSFLEGSKRVSSGGSQGSRNHRSFEVLPQVHGPAVESISAAVRVLEIELNSFDVSVDGGLDCTQISLALNSVSCALDTLVEASLERYRAMQGETGEITVSKCSDASLVLKITSSISRYRRKKKIL